MSPSEKSLAQRIEEERASEQLIELIETKAHPLKYGRLRKFVDDLLRAEARLQSRMDEIEKADEALRNQEGGEGE